MKHFFSLLLFLLPIHVQAEDEGLRSILLNRKAVALYKQEKFDEAMKTWNEALALEPKSATLHLNLALAFEALGQTEKALQSLHTADQMATHPLVQFLSRFNRGVIYQKGKKVDLALEAYHQALDINPSSKETKINIELLIQQQQQQQKQDQGEGESKDQKDNQDQKDQQKDQKDPKDQDKDGKGQNKDQKQKDDQPKRYSKEKPQPKPFKSEELSQADVNKILGELRNQEQRIRSEYNKRDVKEQPRGKDW